jgi:hypothetical protein
MSSTPKRRVQVIGIDGSTIADAVVTVFMAGAVSDQLTKGASAVRLPKYDPQEKEGFDKDADMFIPVHRIGEIRVSGAYGSGEQ